MKLLLVDTTSQMVRLGLKVIRITRYVEVVGEATNGFYGLGAVGCVIVGRALSCSEVNGEAAT